MPSPSLFQLLTRLLVAACLALSSLAAHAGMREIDGGKPPVLKPGEGLLVLVVDTATGLDNATIQPKASFLGGAALGSLDPGRHLRLYAADAGDYAWSQLKLYMNGMHYYVPLKEDSNFGFKVIAGKLSYPGDMIHRTPGSRGIFAHVSNRGLGVIDWLQEKHPGIIERYGFHYSRTYPDLFPEYYLGLQRQHRDSTDTSRIPISMLPSHYLPMELLWKRERVSQISLNPRGDIVAEAVAGEKNTHLELVDYETGEVTVAAVFRSFERFEWIADDVIAIRWDGEHFGNITVLRILGLDKGKFRIEKFQLPRQGRIIDTLPAEPGHILMAMYSCRDKGGNEECRLLVNRIDISSMAVAQDERQYHHSRRLTTGVEGDDGWFTDGSGRLAVMVRHEREQTVLLARQENGFREFLRIDGIDDMVPVALSADGQLLYALTDQDREHRELVSVDVATGKTVRTVHALGGLDIEWPIFDAERVPVGAYFYESGRLSAAYFDEASSRLQARLSAAFPDSSIAVVSRDRSGKCSILAVDASDSPTSYYLFDSSLGRAEKLDDDAPWLESLAMAKAETLKVASEDGFDIEAYLSLPPAGNGPAPLVVMPHGGPIGIRDHRHFDRDVQFLASFGYAVLQVNYRGSEGYGRKFREAGRGSLGTRIESDLMLVLDAVSKRNDIDASKVCVLGQSYGGYAALVAATRWPGRFKCAISVSGVTDRIHHFSATGSSKSATTRAWMEEWFGNPLTESERMRASQPVYNHDRIGVPVLLIHGSEDYRVDYEHSLRLDRLLGLSGQKHALLTLMREGHGTTNELSRKISSEAITGFLVENLGDHRLPASEPAPAPAAACDDTAATKCKLPASQTGPALACVDKAATRCTQP